MSYQWDDYKAATNLEKHGIDFADAVLVFLACIIHEGF
jgi:uncharacterized protein